MRERSHTVFQNMAGGIVSSADHLRTYTANSERPSSDGLSTLYLDCDFATSSSGEKAVAPLVPSSWRTKLPVTPFF